LSAHRWMTSTSVNPTFSILCRTIKITSMLETVATTLVLARSTSSSTDLYIFANRLCVPCCEQLQHHPSRWVHSSDNCYVWLYTNAKLKK
jgi:hypothetical protein